MNLNNINPLDLLKNAQKIQEQMGNMQEKLGDLQVTGSAGGGMVEIDMNGRMEVIAVRIAKEAMEDGDREMLEDLTQAAFSSAMEKVRDAIAGEMGGMFPGGIPGLNFSGLPGMPA